MIKFADSKGVYSIQTEKWERTFDVNNGELTGKTGRIVRSVPKISSMPSKKKI